MILQKLAILFSSLLVITVLSACGNKGDLYLPPDEISEQEMQELQRELEGSDTLKNDPEALDAKADIGAGEPVSVEPLGEAELEAKSESIPDTAPNAENLDPVLSSTMSGGEQTDETQADKERSDAQQSRKRTDSPATDPVEN